MDRKSEKSLSFGSEALVSSGEARIELERILSDPKFRCTERNKKFLLFISEQLFAGRGSALKAYTIAVDVFGRPQDFDASTDSIVRIEATRLRASLIRYYEEAGRSHGVEIRLPKGHYVPEFIRVPEHDRPAVCEDEPPIEARPAALLQPRVRAAKTYIALSCAALLTVTLSAAAAYYSTLGNFTVSDRPTVSLQLTLSGDAADRDALAMRDSLMIALSGFNTLRLSAPESYTASIAAGRRNPVLNSSYLVMLKYSADAAGRSTQWQVVDGDTQEILRSGEERVPVGASSDELVSRLAVRLASIRGVITTVETARDLENPSLGNGCVLRASLALTLLNAELLGNAQTCLERTLELRPYDADAHAMLAAVLLKADPVDAPTVLTEKAREHADEAVALSPESDRSQMAQMQVAMRTGRLEMALLAGGRAVKLNPNNASAAGRYASILFSVGDWERGVPLAEKASWLADMQQPDAERTLAFDAYRRGAFGEAVLRLQRIPESDCYLNQLLLAASLAQAGKPQDAETVVSQLRHLRPAFEQTFQEDMARRQLSPELVAALVDGLKRTKTDIR